MINMDTYAKSPEDYLSFYYLHARSLANARSLFPDQPPHYWATTKRLADYARHKALGMRCRTNGRITDARFHDVKCQRIYKELPDYAKW